jgi:hypothetical protein
MGFDASGVVLTVGVRCECDQTTAIVDEMRAIGEKSAVFC